MTDQDEPDIDDSYDEEQGSAVARLFSRLSRWQKLLLVASVILMVLGIGLRLYAAIDGPSERDDAAVTAAAESGSEANPDLPSGFIATGDPVPATGGDESGAAAEDAGDARGLEIWSPVVFRLGFSFFVGFAIAYAVRSFVKISIIAIGLLLIALFGLQYVGLIEINWAGMETIYDSSITWLKEQTAGFGEFIRGALPSAGMGGLGLVMGFRKKI